ncbi:MAG: exodeoxyribonuclease III [Methanomassiliicoccales archaeon]|jgi:exodeoxyribonuclease-3|nr:exodeoxyribonuclease III [Methanomassiliicoccales archaeon]MDD1755889.1 exodeoxyribonuclease III [Methanomassiliicoccales archaeon]
MRLECWNVNGLRAAHRKGFLDYLGEGSPDILCVQEVKADEDKLPIELKEVPGYHFFVCSPKEEKDKGWSGVGLYTKMAPKKIEYGFGEDAFDQEGRTIVAHFEEFVLLNIYFPNGKSSRERLDFKLEFYDAFLRCAKRLMRGKKQLVVCGDVNTAHEEIDLARPKENSKVSGFLPEERAWLDKFEEAGLIDTLREFDPSPGRYTWWDLKTGARERNVGWRIDYFYITKGLRKRLRSAYIRSDVQGSDHCPIGIELE